MEWNWYETSSVYKHIDGVWYPMTEVINHATGQIVYVGDDASAIDLIELAYALKMGQPKPFDSDYLEPLAKTLEGIVEPYHRYVRWNGRELSYDHYQRKEVMHTCVKYISVQGLGELKLVH